MGLLDKRKRCLILGIARIIYFIVFAEDCVNERINGIDHMLLGRTSSTLYVLENVQNASLKVRSRQENVAGVKVPPSSNISQKVTPRMPSRDWPEVANRSSYVKAIEVLVELASLQTSFLTLDEAIKTTNRRVNALENVVKPRLENTINCIKGELDELEREDFSSGL